MMKANFRRSAVLLSLLATLFIGVGRAAATPIDPPPDPGAPLDGVNHVVTITESAGEGIGTLVVQSGNGPNINIMPDNTVVPGMTVFILPFSLESGPVSCCVLPGDANSDTIVLTGQPNGTTFINLVSDLPSLETLPQPAETGETVTADDHVVPVPHNTTFVINSPAEPVPEPASLTLFGIGLAALGILRLRRKGASQSA